MLRIQFFVLLLLVVTATSTSDSEVTVSTKMSFYPNISCFYMSVYVRLRVLAITVVSRRARAVRTVVVLVRSHQFLVTETIQYQLLMSLQ